MPSLYSHVYIERGERVRESEKARKRFAGFLEGFWEPLTQAGVDEQVRLTFPIRLGVTINHPFQDAAVVFRKAPWNDVLDALTVFYICCGKAIAAVWQAHVNAVFEEENLAYRMADDGSVQPYIDAEFARGVASTLAVLNDPKFEQARNEFDAVQRFLRSGDGLHALRAMFACAETTIKVLIPGNLSAWELLRSVTKYFRPLKLE